MKRAGIYIRVSSEQQGKKASPEAQEEDCRKLCKSRGYQIIGIYRDISKYRIGNRLVEPSGTRADRPGLKEIIKDAYDDKLDVIVAWREDRLYRSYRPMLDVLDCIEKTSIDIELATETFDKRFAGVKVWVAKMELEAKHERLMMGVSKRLEKGKAWNGSTPYGYDCLDGVYHVNDEEAYWVHKIYEWFADGDSAKTIRSRLINGNAPQRGEDLKLPWPVQRIYHMLKRDFYHVGYKIRKWNGETYDIPIPPIIDTELAKSVKARLKRWKAYPAGNLKEKALGAGLVYCEACNLRMKVKANKFSTYYECYTVNYSGGDKVGGCAGTRSIRILDEELWNKIWNLIADPGAFEAAIRQRINSLQAEEENAQVECERLERGLNEIFIERQKVITWARKNFITEEDLETQLTALSFQEKSLIRELNEKRLLVGNRAERLLELANTYRKRVQAGIEGINTEPKTPEQAKRVFRFKKKIIEAVVTRIDVREDKSIKIYTEFDLTENISQSLASFRSS